ncbi:HIT family protein [Dermatobacter hominis]|nr:HIT family protein [Dermatobacter hominis]UDY37023.1 HIT family protein [Dermatobacter hominis]
MAPAAGRAGSCVFCEIVEGTAPAQVVFADDVVVAFLDRTPLFPGHTLVVPRAHVVTLPDLPAELVGPYFERVQAASRAVQAGMAAAGTFVAMNNTVSQSVPHLHTHVVPRNPKDGLRGFFWPRRKYADDAEMAEAAERVRDAWA